MCCIVTKCWLLAQVSRDNILLDLQNFLDFGKILGLRTIFDFRECYLWIYDLNQDLKLFSRFDKLFKSDLSKRCWFRIFFRFYKICLDCPFRLPYYSETFTEPEVNNCFCVIAQALSSSAVNRFVVETILLQLEFNRFK